MVAKVKKVELPKGFKPITSGSVGTWWDFKTKPLIEGTILKFFEIKDNFNEGEMKPAVELETKDGPVALDYRAGYRVVFDLEVGSKVAIAYVGRKAIKGRKEAMHDFTVGVK